ncbi:MAG TPA: flagellar hook capping FlgD N-terminal domain-containing protein [Acidothermaceae bacterium]|nr:flagellar hook capping FlgD N-terminal domain-containing protein [Acidothermaceae bacterium]
MTTPITGVGATPSTSPATSSGSSDVVDLGGINSNTFLKLLVAQLSHQDPMNPTDSSTYITEEAQFSMVQSMNTLSKQNAQILQSQQMQEATGFIGKNVTYVDSNGVQGVGVVASASPGDASTGAVVRIGTAQIPVSSITSVFAGTPTTNGTTATP